VRHSQIRWSLTCKMGVHDNSLCCIILIGLFLARLYHLGKRYRAMGLVGIMVLIVLHNCRSASSVSYVNSRVVLQKDQRRAVCSEHQ
jgi:hypothetical protein